MNNKVRGVLYLIFGVVLLLGALSLLAAGGGGEAVGDVNVHRESGRKLGLFVIPALLLWRGVVNLRKAPKAAPKG